MLVIGMHKVEENPKRKKLHERANFILSSKKKGSLLLPPGGKSCGGFFFVGGWGGVGGDTWGGVRSTKHTHHLCDKHTEKFKRIDSHQSD